MVINKLKNIIKKFPGFEYFYYTKRSFDYFKDRRFFLKNCMYSFPVTKEKLEYDMLFQIHKLEKGFSVTKNLRPFGKGEITKIIKDILIFEKKGYEKNFAYNLAYSSLFEYKNFYNKHNWTETEQYKVVVKFLENKENCFISIPVGSFDYTKESFCHETKKVDYNKFIATRRSVRNFSKKKLKEKDIIYAVKAAISTPTACNRQMCKIYYINSNENKIIIEKFGQGLGLFELENANYFLVTFDMNACYFDGERNQGWFNSGLVTMNFVNSLHSLGIGSCCIQFGNDFKEEKLFKQKLNIPNNERVAVIITAGYYDNISRIPYSTRKPLEEIYKER